MHADAGSHNYIRYASHCVYILAATSKYANNTVIS